MKREKKTIRVNLWDVVGDDGMDDINTILDTKLKKGFACDIQYKCVGITKNGIILLEATYDHMTD